MTGLAFVFVPISLAGTIFGMNVQQINESGPDITVFVITSIAMAAFTVLIWALSHSFTSTRRIAAQRYLESEIKPKQSRTWTERALFVGINRQRRERWFQDRKLPTWHLLHPLLSYQLYHRKIYETYILPLLGQKVKRTPRDQNSEWSARNSETA